MNESDIIIREEEENMRLDKILASRFQAIHSRTYFQFLIDEERVLLNGSPTKKRVKPKAGDEVEVEFILTPELDLEAEAIPLDILYEDADLLAINKPAGLVVHPAVGNWTGTFVNALLYHCEQLKKLTSDSIRPGIVHRLDKETTGVLLAAKNPDAQKKLIDQFCSRQIEKEYLAICVGNPGEVEISAPIGRSPYNRKVMSVVEEGGKSALTLCKTLACNEQLSVVQILLKTGRTHQIRVHMKYQGTPVLGDSVYGSLSANKKHMAKRPLLHAHRLKFIHPMTKKMLEIVAPIPADMHSFMQKIEGCR